MSIIIDSINLYIKNMPKTVMFYKLLGLKLPEGAETQKYTRVQSDLGVKFAFYTQESINEFFGTEMCFETQCHPLNISFRCESPNEVNEKYKRVTKAGFNSLKAPKETDWGQYVAFLLDPDNNIIELNVKLI